MKDLGQSEMFQRVPRTERETESFGPPCSEVETHSANGKRRGDVGRGCHYLRVSVLFLTDTATSGRPLPGVLCQCGVSCKVSTWHAVTSSKQYSVFEGEGSCLLTVAKSSFVL